MKRGKRPSVTLIDVSSHEESARKELVSLNTACFIDPNHFPKGDEVGNV